MHLLFYTVPTLWRIPQARLVSCWRTWGNYLKDDLFAQNWYLQTYVRKTVIITGSQVPLTEVRNDAVENLLGALTIAGHFVIPEVCLYFGDKLYRGNRTSKISAVDFDAFDSPNLPALVNLGIDIGNCSVDVLEGIDSS